MTGNDNWQETEELKVQASGIAPGNAEAAVVAPVWPGNYTAIVRGKDNTTGIGSIEVYNAGPASANPPAIALHAAEKVVKLPGNLTFDWQTSGDMTGLECSFASVSRAQPTRAVATSIYIPGHVRPMEALTTCSPKIHGRRLLRPTAPLRVRVRSRSHFPTQLRVSG